MAAGTERPNPQTGAARRHSLHRKVMRNHASIVVASTGQTPRIEDTSWQPVARPARN